MDIFTEKLSNLTSPVMTTGFPNIGIYQFERTYTGNYKINFPLFLENANDLKTLNYSNFYLTDDSKFSEYFNTLTDKLKNDEIITVIEYSNSYLKFSKADEKLTKIENNKYMEYKKYGVPVFATTNPDIFHIQFKANNYCNIFYKIKNIKYFLAATSDNKLLFVDEIKLSFDETNINPQDFQYLFSESDNNIIFFKKTANGNYRLANIKNKLELVDNTLGMVYDSFKLSRNFYNESSLPINNSFITYNNNDNNIDLEKSEFSLSNNFLIHKTYTDNTNKIGIICLKNNLTTLDVYSSSNNLLSAGSNIYVDQFREYTNILNNIQEEKSDDLKLNYVYYNQPYIIKPGYNTFISPSSLYPFLKLNINDTKFVDSGAFSYTTPEYADKVYLLSNQIENVSNGQYLLCTWLSGHPNGSEKIWVDRYYYPDLISKEAALSGTSFFNTTYDNYVESLIMDNLELRDNVSLMKFFDKRSDFYFESNKTYKYERLKIEEKITNTVEVGPCVTETSTIPLNYFEDINNKGEFTLIFEFASNTSSWSVKSLKNEINCGIEINKTNTSLEFIYTIYNQSNAIVSEYKYTTELAPLKYNILCFSISSVTGLAYLYLGNEIVYRFDLSPYKYIKYRLLYSDIFYTTTQEETNILLLNSDNVKNVSLTTNYTPEEYSSILPIVLGYEKVNDIVITLPCGMRNSVDDISILQDICGSSIFKSSNINILIKNIDTNNVFDENDMKEYLINNISEQLPPPTNINQIKFKRFK